MERKTDLRVVKTKRAIYTAFIRLMNSKGFSAMTVQDLLQEALINRKTFYTYYRDKYDLAEQVAQSFLDHFDAILAECFPGGEPNPPAFSMVDRVYEELYRNKQELRAIWSIRTDRIDVLSELHGRLQKVYLNMAAYYEAPGDVMLQSYMFSSFVLASYQHIMENDQPYESHKLLREYQHLYDVIDRASRQEAPRPPQPTE